jgi:hypothetical protein
VVLEINIEIIAKPHIHGGIKVLNLDIDRQLGHDKIYAYYFCDNLMYDMGDFLEGDIG